MKKREPIFFLLTLFSLFQSPVFAAKKSYVVYLGEHSHGSQPTEADFDRVKSSHHDLLASSVGSLECAKAAIVHSYTKHINGFTANLEEEEAEALSKDPNVISVFPNGKKKLYTTHSWNFLGLDTNGGVVPNSLWEKARYGEDLIIGVVDSGIWPESESFNDEGYGPIPSRWKGFCQNEDRVSCNRKLIGARYFNRAFNTSDGPLPSKTIFHSARDYTGHGTHTLSTAGGNFVVGANAFGFANGTAKGGAPKARLASYKVMWPKVVATDEDSGGASDGDIMAAIDAAIHDGVDVLSLSLGGRPLNYFKDALSIGSFHAIKKGIIVVSATGNQGPEPGSATNVAPWFLTVGASTIDREFVSYAVLGNEKRLRGRSLSLQKLPLGKLYPLISGIDAKVVNATAAELCIPTSLDPEKVKGKILVCLSGEIHDSQKSEAAAKAGAVGVILVNTKVSGNLIEPTDHSIPTSHISSIDGLAVFSYMNSTESPTASITPATTELNTKPAPYVADFSSRGPNYRSPEILKPDIIAPAVNILAAFSQAAEANIEYFFDQKPSPFQFLSGSSMSCPQVAAIAGLLKIIHPDWSPAAIKSAIMTTAKTRTNIGTPILDTWNLVKETPFGYGAGHIRPNHAMNPGLVYDLTVNDYLNYLCSVRFKESTVIKLSHQKFKCPEFYEAPNLNYPAISVPGLGDSYTVTRTLKNVGSPGTYNVTIHRPRGVSVTVNPNSLTFNKIGEEKTFTMKLKVQDPEACREYVFGSFKWSDGKHTVRSPIIVSTYATTKHFEKGRHVETDVAYSDSASDL